MDKKTKVAVIGSSAVILLIILVAGLLIKRYVTPSNEVLLLTDYYPIENEDVLVILQDEIYEKKGLVLDGKVYLDYETIIDKFNHRFYWDDNENILTYTTPNEIIQAQAGETDYTVTKSMIKTKVSSDYPIVEVFAKNVYIALDFVKKYSDLNYQYYKEPNRVVIQYKWGDFLYTEVKKATQLREEADIKSPILVELAQGTNLAYVEMDEAPRNGFSKVMTADGIIGYVRNKHIKKSFYKTIESDYVAPEYVTQTRPGKINLVFHQVFNKDANANLEELIKATKGVTVVSPTWFSINDVSGTFSSIASKEYVEKAKSLGLEVWALIDDFNPEVSMLELLSHTSRRETLSNALVEAALEYQLNGINIDFEKISSEAGKHYVQFIRELSVKCRNNGIVLSIDTYVPSPYTRHYGREELGVVADYIIVMAYDEHHGGSEIAGPVSSLGFVEDAVNNILTVVPKEKTIIAIPFYTRLWKETPDGDVSAESLAMTPAANTLEANNATIEWNDTYGCYYGEYEKDGAIYKMWQEEDRSIEEKLKVIYDADVAGIGAWKLGLEKESIWNVVIRYLN